MVLKLLVNPEDAVYLKILLYTLQVHHWPSINSSDKEDRVSFRFELYIQGILEVNVSRYLRGRTLL